MVGLHCCTWAFSSCSEKDYSSLQCASFSLQIMGFRVLAQRLWSTGLVAPPHMGSSQTRD